MAYKISYTEDSLIELEALIDYIRADNQTAAERLGKTLLAHIDLLRTFPRLGPTVPQRRVRKLFHSPITIYYRIDEGRRTIEILHFWHGSRNEPDL